MPVLSATSGTLLEEEPRSASSGFSLELGQAGEVLVVPVTGDCVTVGGGSVALGTVEACLLSVVEVSVVLVTDDSFIVGGVSVALDTVGDCLLSVGEALDVPGAVDSATAGGVSVALGAIEACLLSSRSVSGFISDDDLFPSPESVRPVGG